MRIRRLDLTRYGKFTDRTIDFGPRPDDRTDLHIVFGMNEAGKSTAVNGYLDLLFGMEERSRYSFLHEYSSMRVGGVLEMEGSSREFARVKQRTNSLLDENGQPAAEMALSAHLSGLSRADYVNMFSLDDDTLEAGGKAILESRGDLGQLLFAAGAGLSHASEMLDAIQSEADRIYKKHAQGTEMAGLKKQLAEMKAARDGIDTLASTYEALEAERIDASARYDLTLSERSVLTSRLQTIGKHERALPMLAELERRKARLQELPATPAPVTAWDGKVAELIANDATVNTRIAANAAELLHLEKKLGEVNVDARMLALSVRIDGLRDLKARHEAGAVEMSSLRTELHIRDGAIGNILETLGRPLTQDPRKLLLPVTVVGILRTLIEKRSGIDAAIRAARDEARTAVDALRSSQDRVVDRPAIAPATRARLASALSRSRESGHDRRLSEARNMLEECESRWASARSHLHPWEGDASDLAKMDVPASSHLLQLRKELDESTARRAALTDRVAELEETRRSIVSALSAIRRTSDVPDDAMASAARRSRDIAWTRHRERMVDETADAFEAILAQDDAIGTKQLANASAVQELRNADARLGDTDAALARVGIEIDAADESIDLIAVSIREVIDRVLPGRVPFGSPGQELEVLQGLLASRTMALEAWQALERCLRGLRRIENERDSAFAELTSAAGLAGIEFDGSDDLASTVAAVEYFLEQQAALVARSDEAQRTLAERKEDLASRQRALEAAERLEQDWLASLGAALSGTWLDGIVATAALGHVLDQLGRLAEALQDRESLVLRIERIEAEDAVFHAEIAAIAHAMGQSLENAHAGPTAGLLLERARQAERSNEARIALLAEIDRLRDARHTLLTELDMQRTHKSAMLQAYGAATLPDVIDRQEAFKERDRLCSAIAELEGQIVSELGVEDLDAARMLLDAADSETLAVEKVELDRRLTDIEEALAQQLIRRTRATDKLDAIGSDSAVARIDARRRTVLLEIEDKATHYLRLRVGAMTASDALRQYRDRHRTGMMRRASDAFAMMTRGAYSGLSSQPIKGGEVLIAMMRDGGSKVADALSKGTRFQLYLALRLAGYQEFANLRPTVPFIADDIMETFDHLRSEEVLRLFGEMAKLGQVIYLTHHQHLCDIARSVVPGVVIHEIAR